MSMAKKVKTEPPPGCISEAEQPYKVPENWRWVKLTEGFAECKDNCREPINAKEREKRAGNIPYYGATGQVGWIDDYLTDEHLVLLGEDGAPFLDSFKDKAYVIDGKAWVNNHAHILKSYFGKTGNIFLAYYLNAFNYKGYVNGSTRLKLTQANMSRIPIPLPPLPEQNRIVDRIESLFTKLDVARAEAQSVVDEYELRRDAILYRAFTGELTAGWREKNGIPDNSWNTERLEACFEVTGGIQKQKARIPKDNPVPYVTVANVLRNRIDLSEIRYFELFEGELEKYQLRSEDILVVEGNGSGNEIGRCAMWNAEIPVCVHQNHIIRVRKKGSRILPKYVLYYLNSPMGRTAMRVQAKTTAGLYNLSVGKVKSISIPMATTEEQVEIVSLLDSLLSKSMQEHDAAKEMIEGIDTTKKSILARAFRGELGTNDPAEESTDAILQTIQEMRRNSP